MKKAESTITYFSPRNRKKYKSAFGCFRWEIQIKDWSTLNDTWLPGILVGTLQNVSETVEHTYLCELQLGCLRELQMSNDDFKKWLLRDNRTGKENGPYSSCQIRATHDAGKLSANIEISMIGTNDWFPIEEFNSDKDNVLEGTSDEAADEHRPANGESFSSPKWFISRHTDGKVFGPYTSDEIRRSIDEKKVNPADKISLEGSDYWTPFIAFSTKRLDEGVNLPFTSSVRTSRGNSHVGTTHWQSSRYRNVERYARYCKGLGGATLFLGFFFLVIGIGVSIQVESGQGFASALTGGFGVVLAGFGLLVTAELLTGFADIAENSFKTVLLLEKLESK